MLLLAFISNKYSVDHFFRALKYFMSFLCKFGSFPNTYQQLSNFLQFTAFREIATAESSLPIKDIKY